MSNNLEDAAREQSRALTRKARIRQRMIDWLTLLANDDAEFMTITVPKQG